MVSLSSEMCFTHPPPSGEGAIQFLCGYDDCNTGSTKILGYLLFASGKLRDLCLAIGHFSKQPIEDNSYDKAI
jgi:hypothetical protein